MFKLIIITFSLLLLACTQKINNLQHEKLQNLSISKKYQLKVEDIHIIEKYKSPFTYPYLEHQISNPPSFIVKNWINQSLLTVGQEYILKIIIKDASITERKINSETYIYEAKINVDLTVIDENIPLLQNEIEVIEQVSTLNRQDPIKDKKFFNQLTESILENFIKKVENSLYNSFYEILIK